MSKSKSRSKSRKPRTAPDQAQSAQPESGKGASAKMASEQLSLAEMASELPADRGNGAHPDAAEPPAESASEAPANKGGKAPAPPQAETPAEPAPAEAATEGDGGEAPAEATGPAIVELVNSAEGCYQKLETGETVELSDAEWRKALARMLERKPAAG